MPRESVSVEDFPISNNCSRNSLFCPSLPPRSSSYNFALQVERPKSVDLTQPVQAAFPSPPAFVDPTPLVQASRARDAFPFPLQPALVSKATAETGHTRYEVSSPKRRCVSNDSPYLTPPTSPDRFIPTRRSPESSAKSFHLSKPSDQLTTIEKLIRHQSVSQDPFSTRIPSRIDEGGLPSHEIYNGSPTPSPSRPFTVGGGDVLGVRPGSIGIADRRPSAGAIWNVGGSVASSPGPITGVSNGRGGLLGTGTNAPMFSSRFFETETPDQSRERFEGRLAVALDIDQTSRTLSISQSPEPEVFKSPIKNGKRRVQAGTFWRDGRWHNEDTESREFCHGDLSITLITVHRVC